MLMILIYWVKTYITKKNSHTLLHDSKEVGLDVKAETTKYMVMSHHQNTGHKHKLKVAKEVLQSSDIRLIMNVAS